MKIRLFLLFMSVAMATMAQKTVGIDWSYNVKCAGVTPNGDYMVEVECVGRKVDVAMDHAKKSAVYDVLFKGINGSVAGCTTQRAIVSDPSALEAHLDYFKKFFDKKKGSYSMYVLDINGSQPQITKVSGGYSINVTLIVLKDKLRMLMEKEQIVRGLSSGF